MATQSRTANAGRVLRASTAVKPPVNKDTPLKNAREAQEDAGVALRLAGVNPFAKRMADKISADTIAEFESAIASDEYQKVVGLLFAEHISADFTPEEIAACPVCIPRSDAEEYFEAHKGSNLLDWTKVKDGKKTKWVSVFDGMLEAHPFTVSLRKQIEAISDVINSKVGYNAELKKQFPNEAEQKAHLKRLNKKITTMTAKWRTGWRVVQQRAQITDLFGDHILYAETRDNEGNLLFGPEPIYLEKAQEKGVKGRWDNFSVSSFLSLKPQAALDAREKDTPTASWDALLATLERVDDDDTEDKDNIVITNNKRFETGMASMLAFINDHPEAITAMVKRVNGAKEVSEIAPLALTIGDLANELLSLKQNIQKRYESAHHLEALNSGQTLDAKTQRDLANAG